MLHIQHIHKSFGRFEAIKDLSLKVEAGEIYCLLGANGAGKSTTINLCLGFLKPDQGRIEINGIDMQQDPVTGRHEVSYIPENLMLYPRLTGIENMDYFSGLGGKRYTKAELQAFLEEAGLQPEFFRKRIQTYSKGMRQKVGIALALASEASVLLLDEPTSGLDPLAGHEFASLLARFSAAGKAVLMATHDLFRARETGTRIGIMREGQLVEEFPAASIGAQNLEQLYLNHMSHAPLSYSS